jgi:hypothetical protein
MSPHCFRLVGSDGRAQKQAGLRAKPATPLKRQRKRSRGGVLRVGIASDA